MALSVVLASIFSAPFAAASGAHHAASIQVLPKSGPHTLTDSAPIITFFFYLHHVKMDRHFGSSDAPNQGHVQMYLDHVPSDAYSTKDLHGVAAYAAAFKLGTRYTVSIQFGSKWIKAHQGHHTLLIGLARNNFVMLRAKVQRFSLQISTKSK